MPEIILAVLKYFFLLLIFLFLARAVRAMYLEVAGPKAGRASGRPQAAVKTRRPPERLTVTPGDGGKPRTYTLEEELLVGRSDRCHIVISDSYASEVHARIFRRDDSFFVEDMGSTNGTYLNRKRVTSAAPVGRGDRLRIGKTELDLKK